MTEDKNHIEPGTDFELKQEDEAFLRLVEDCYEAAGQPKDKPSADRVWGRLEAALAEGSQPNELARGATVHPIQIRRQRSRWTYAIAVMAAAAGLLLFIQPHGGPLSDSSGLQTRGGEAGFKSELKIYEPTAEGGLQELSPNATAAVRRVKVKAKANADGYVALVRQQGKGSPIVLSSLPYKSEQGELTLLEEDAPRGTRFCILGARNEAGLKHLIELVPNLWEQLPATSCQSIP